MVTLELFAKLRSCQKHVVRYAVPCLFRDSKTGSELTNEKQYVIPRHADAGKNVKFVLLVWSGKCPRDLY